MVPITLLILRTGRTAVCYHNSITWSDIVMVSSGHGKKGFAQIYYMYKSVWFLL